MQIQRYVMGSFATNTYLLTNGDECILIDPASKEEKIKEKLGDKKLLAILLTHGHFDHIKAVDGLVKEFGCPVYINEDDEALARDPNQCPMFGLGATPHISSKLSYFKEGCMSIGSFDFEVIFTPGHTEGSVCLRFDKDLFTGDTLFKLSVGRTDLDGGNNSKLKMSLRILKEMDDDLIIHPGHEDESLMSFEKQFNPFLR